MADILFERGVFGDTRTVENDVTAIAIWQLRDGNRPLSRTRVIIPRDITETVRRYPLTTVVRTVSFACPRGRSNPKKNVILFRRSRAAGRFVSARPYRSALRTTFNFSLTTRLRADSTVTTHLLDANAINN